MRKHSGVLSKCGFWAILCLLLTLATTNQPIRKRLLTEDDAYKSVSNGTPSSWDWRLEMTMTPVKNQADCNAYYAFSTIAFF